MLPLDIDALLTFQKTIAFAALALLIAAAYGDVRTFRIPNILVLSITTLGIFRLILLGNPMSAIYAVVMVLLIFIIGFVLFSLRLIGGGDVKLLMATILLIRYQDFFSFLVLMSLFGAGLSLVVVVVRNYLPIFVGPRLGSYMATIRPAVPYGVAIAGAGIVTLLFQPMLFRYSSFAPSFLW